MRVIGLFAAVLLCGVVSAQAPQAVPPAARVRRPGGFVPGQDRAPGDPVQIARGKTLYEIGCRGCHGADLRGGDMGGPNLLRSQLSLSDQDGELIVPIIQGSRQDSGMPKIPMSPADGKATAAYVRSILATIGGQGTPPSIGQPVANILVGDADAGQAYFDSKCSSCHSATGDLKGIGKRIADAKTLQNSWVSGGTRAGRGPAPATVSKARTVTATITHASGERTEGKLLRMDDFIVTLELEDGSVKSFRRNGDSPKVEVRDPMQPHRDLLSIYTDKDMHNVTAYLVTLK